MLLDKPASAQRGTSSCNQFSWITGQGLRPGISTRYIYKDSAEDTQSSLDGTSTVNMKDGLI